MIEVTVNPKESEEVLRKLRQMPRSHSQIIGLSRLDGRFNEKYKNLCSETDVSVLILLPMWLKY